MTPRSHPAGTRRPADPGDLPGRPGTPVPGAGVPGRPPAVTVQVSAGTPVGSDPGPAGIGPATNDSCGGRGDETVPRSRYGAAHDRRRCRRGEDPGRSGRRPARLAGGSQQALRAAARAAGRQHHRRPRRGRRGDRPVRVGQVHALPRDQPAGADRLGPDRGGRPAAAGGGQGAGPAARRRRHGLPVVQPLRAQDDPAKRHARPDQGPRQVQGRRAAAGDGAAGAGRHRQPGGQAAGAAVRRSAAAGRHRPRAGDGPQADALRRADLGARPGDDQRGARRHDVPRARGHDDDGGHPRDGLRPPGGRPRDLHGGRQAGRAGTAGGVLQRPQERARPGLPVQDSHPLTHERIPPMRLRTLAAGMAALALALTACGDDGGGGGGEAASIVDKAKNDKKLVIGIKYDQPGLGLRSADGTVSGFDVEMAKYIAKELGVEESGIEWKETVSSNREPFIQQGQVDMVVATYSITDTRKEKVSFAGPYFVAGQSLLVRADNTDITGAESLNNNKKLCSVQGSTPAKKIKEEYAKNVQLQEYDSYSKCVDALLGG